MRIEMELIDSQIGFQIPAFENPQLRELLASAKGNYLD